MSLLPFLLDHVNQVYSWGWRFSVTGAIITFIGVSLLMWTTRIKDHRFEVNMSQLDIDAAKANERAANAEVRAAEANLELAKLKAPRTLSLEQQDRVVEKLKKFSGTTFQIITYPGEPEPAAFSNIIASILVRAGWQFNPNNSRGSLLGLASGVIIVVGRQAGTIAEEKGKSLLEALVSEGISAKLGYSSLQINPVAIEIKIQVAKKP